jgi:cell division protein FtsB
MSQPRWRRLLPDTSQLWILAAVLAVIFFGVSFLNLAGEKSQVMARQRAVQQQLQTLEEQNQRLREALAETQTGANIEMKARLYYGYSFPGETRIVALPSSVQAEAPAPVTEVPQASEPFWMSLWKRLSHLDK